MKKILVLVMAMLFVPTAEASVSFYGTSGDDDIFVYESSIGYYDASINDEVYVGYSSGPIYVYGYGGNDVIEFFYRTPDEAVSYWCDGGYVSARPIGVSGDCPTENGSGYSTITDAGLENDTVYGCGCDDQINGNSGNDYLSGSLGSDYIMGGYGIDKLYGDDGVDYLYGADDTDCLWGGNGNDYLYSGADNDCIADSSWSAFDCGPGDDSDWTIGSPSNCEHFVMGWTCNTYCN